MAVVWPAGLRGVTESVVTTLGPNGRWNVAALGVHAPNTGGGHATARTWGRTRTWRNFRERGEGYVQFVTDPVLFVDAALTIREVDEPVLSQAHAWVRVTVDALDSGTSGNTQWVEWQLTPEEAATECRTVPTFNRGYAAVVEATVAASRLEVPAYDTEQLYERLEYFEEVVDRCGGPREQAAFDRIEEYVDSIDSLGE